MRQHGPLPLLLVLLAATIFLTSYPITMTNLIIDEEPVVADVIIVPEGGGEERPRTSAALLRQGFSRSGKIIVSPLTAFNAPFYRQNHVSAAQIMPENQSTSTYENAVYTLAMMEANDFSSAIIVSSDYHMLRTKLIYERVNTQYDYELTYVAASHIVDNELVAWYQAPQAQRAGQNEFFKYWGYLLGLYHFINLP